MRKLVALFLMLSFAVSILPTPIFADYVIGNENEGEWEIENENIHEFPFDVEVTDRVHRYAVDVIYEEMVVNVKSAVWNVNTYVYDVEIEEYVPETEPVEPNPEETNASNEQLPILKKAKPFSVIIVNHSDRAIYTRITPISLYTQIAFEQAPIFMNVVTIPGVLFLEDVSERKPTYISSAITAVETIEGGWESLVNELIATGSVQNGESVIGELQITISPN